MTRLLRNLVLAAAVSTIVATSERDGGITDLMTADEPVRRSPGGITDLMTADEPVRRSLRSQDSQKRSNVFVTLREDSQAALTKLNVQNDQPREVRAALVRAGLRQHANHTQHAVFRVLERSKKSYSSSRSFWITNQVYIKDATAHLIEKLRKTPGVADVSHEVVHSLVLPVKDAPVYHDVATPLESPDSSAANPIPDESSGPDSWGLTKLSVPSVWLLGNKGKNVVVGSIDTGVRVTHEALSASYRGEYGWFDPERKSDTPYDVVDHGTHVMGTIVGSDGIGLAPKAKWMSCKGCREDGCYTSDLLECFEFMLCPTRVDGSGKDCSKAPHVVTNNWVGARGMSTFYAAIDAWKAAGIIPVFAAGNEGPLCSTVGSPADYAAVITVGATDTNDMLAPFSSKGPTAAGLTKPDLSAPGVAIRSSCVESDTSYCIMSGTSMAASHVTGTIALMLSARSDMQFQSVKQRLIGSAAKSKLPSSARVCGGTHDSAFPNNQYGYGRVDTMGSVA